MLIQLQKQKRNSLSQTQMVAQCDPGNPGFIEKFGKENAVLAWVKDVQSRHQLAEDEQWMLCDETYQYFKFGIVRE